MKTIKISLMLAGILIISCISACKKEKDLPASGKKGITMVSTIIGKKIAYARAGYVDGPVDVAKFRGLFDLACDAQGNVYMAEGGYDGNSANNVIRKVTPSGMVSTIAGSRAREYGLADGTGTAARFNCPNGLAIDASGNIYVADSGNHCIRKITPSGVVTTVAGNGTSGYTDGPAATAQFNFPKSVAIGLNGDIYVADARNNRIRKITAAGTVSTLAGNGSTGLTNGPGNMASFIYLNDIATDRNGNIFVSDGGQYVNAIRKITPAGEVSTLAGGKSYGTLNGRGEYASFMSPSGLDIDTDGNLYVVDYSANQVRKITPNADVTTVAGLWGVGEYKSLYVFGGYVDGPSSIAMFFGPTVIAVDPSGSLYVGEEGNVALRKITFE